ncbi:MULTISPECIES: acyl-CoA dehydrogenase family protein [Pseudomonas]|uniref:Acyl-CoA dehydrogenase, middle domain n=2 Tax=Pseudomonas TaxID=286 RepID=A0ABY0VBK3_9PSED|nr:MULTISPECIES: acyl-CoA dehydrogenase family protein [Pseudomonas]MBU0523724.1 acyl-CoA dehydrogenase family protein [Gammaproteobacteria bacterium]MBU0817553.1 acyl-CoA dehydrogenase family protein [Gammaproteobacteria bacterium]MBU0844745.1 acyl-CoA dehydrogenase family protein [Gammaproteobacteria bacterium]MBU1843049.1 acyl-CoA dehydrogenase family protein [Gammaproteobacteria bacterium]PMV81733.1 acyl-CoA dehydrogenase [Pseudomonas sp. GW101-1A09]
MPWQNLLNRRDRLPVNPDLAEGFATLLHALGTVTPLELAVVGGRLMSTPGLAFLVGYQAALRMLWPSAPLSLGALCATEQRSLRVADMQTRLSDLRVSGRKDFVTAGDAADWLLVAARSEASGETPRLSLAVVYPDEPGVRLEKLPAIALMPDISHGRLFLDNAQCELLAGDGWDAYVKPFRTLEDIYVLSAMTAWLYGVGQDSDWPQALQLRLLALLAGCAEVSRQAPNNLAGHVLLGGLFAQFEGLKAELNEALADGPQHWAAMWQRDQSVMDLAAGARGKRLAKALAAI